MNIPEYLNITNEDNMDLMSRHEDNYFDLAIVDPPYGISINANMGLKKGQKKRHNTVKWDDEIPSEDYFKELFRVSKNQIIWGGNYFHLPANKHFIFWDKLVPSKMSFSDGEYAWTSFDKAIKKIVLRNSNGGKIHPTEKPVALYTWLLQNYAKPNQKILDTHGGSMSIAIAVHNMNQIENMNLELTLCELDEDYFNDGLKRIQEHVKQGSLFKKDVKPVFTQTTLL